MEACSIDTIVCPQCEAVLDVQAEVCYQCGSATWTAAAAAGPVTDRPAGRQKKSLVDRPWVILVVMLHVGLLGIPLYWKTHYSPAVRVLLVVASIVYTVLAVAGIWWGIAMILRLIQTL